jgi:hypothetical protein
MKKFVFGLLAIAMFGFTTNAQTKFVKMTLPKSVQSPAGASETIVHNVSFKNAAGVQSRGQIRYVIPEVGKGLISLEFSDNILAAGGIRADFFVQNPNALEGEPGTATPTLAECLAKCHESFTRPDGSKIPGRGQCKAACWWGELKDLLPLILTLLT